MLLFVAHPVAFGESALLGDADPEMDPAEVGPPVADEAQAVALVVAKLQNGQLVAGKLSVNLEKFNVISAQCHQECSRI